MTTQQLWRAIHVYPRVRGVDGFDALLASVRRLLPCDACRGHLDHYVIENPPDTSSREALFVWGWALHESVNAKIGKEGITLDDAQRQWNRAIIPSVQTRGNDGRLFAG